VEARRRRRSGEPTTQSTKVGETAHVGTLRKSGIGCSSDKQSSEQQKMFAVHDFTFRFIPVACLTASDQVKNGYAAFAANGFTLR
jgi:hypothetical protein